MSSRALQKHNMIILSGSKFTWGGTNYPLVSVNAGTTIPTELSVGASTGETRNNLPSITDKTFTKSFIIPTVFDALSVVDGIAEGTIKLGAFVPTTGGNAGNFIDVTKAELEINAIDTLGASRNIFPLSEIWSGSVKSTKQGQITEQFLYWIDMDDVIVSADERMVLDFTITYTVFTAFSNDDFTASIFATLDTDETTLTLPFVM